jgi:hypothetical protein
MNCSSTDAASSGILMLMADASCDERRRRYWPSLTQMSSSDTRSTGRPFLAADYQSKACSHNDGSDGGDWWLMARIDASRRKDGVPTCSADAKPHTAPPARPAAEPQGPRSLQIEDGWLKRQSSTQTSSAQTTASHNQLYINLTTSSAGSMRLSASWQAHRSRAPTSMAR